MSLENALRTEQPSPSETSRKDLAARHWLTAAEHLQRMDQFIQSKKYADLAFTTYYELTKQYPQDSNYLALLSDSQLLQAKAIAESGQREVAIEQCLKVQDRLTDIAVINQDPKYSVPYARALDCLGHLDMHPALVSMLQQNDIINYRF